VFLPHHGLDPIVGLEALKRFWWPADGPETRIVRFDLETSRVEGTADLAYAWGRQRLEWTQHDAQGLRRFRTRGNHLTVFRRTDAGWRIALQMGDDEPNESF
jgi:ketosteroid isomerase-like protein